MKNDTPLQLDENNFESEVIQSQPSSPSQSRSRSSNITSGTINVNTASYEELQQIIGVGPVIAQRIIDGRPFRSVGDLIQVRGIGPVSHGCST